MNQIEQLNQELKDLAHENDTLKLKLRISLGHLDEIKIITSSKMIKTKCENAVKQLS